MKTAHSTSGFAPRSGQSPRRGDWWSELPSTRSNARVKAQFLLLALTALCLVFPAVRGQSSSHKIEYELKAGYLYNFAKFVEWPPPPLAAAGPFRVGVIADENAYAIIADTLKGRMIGDHPVVVVLLKPDADASGCRVVFIPRTAMITPAQFHAHQPKARVLLVGEKDGFAASGGEIGFVPRGDNLRYQVNLSAAEHAGLRLSARLASLAEIVHIPSL
jgi:hypothetical protein